MSAQPGPSEHVRAERWWGSVPALVTPLTPEREIDEDGVAALVARALADGAAGVLVASVTGEGTLLTPEQRAQATRRARAALDDAVGAPGAVGLLAGASGPTVEALVDDVTRLAASGADATLVLAPHTQPLTPDELADLHLAVAERAPGPMLVDHAPQLTGSALTPRALGRVLEHPGVTGLLDASPDAERRARFVETAEERPGFRVLTGHAATLHTALEDGVDGSALALANLRQHEVVALHEAVVSGSTERAGRLQERLTRLGEGVGGAGASVPAVLKAALQLDGVIAERWCRPPLRSVSGHRLDRVRTAMLG